MSEKITADIARTMALTARGKDKVMQDQIDLVYGEIHKAVALGEMNCEVIIEGEDYFNEVGLELKKAGYAVGVEQVCSNPGRRVLKTIYTIRWGHSI